MKSAHFVFSFTMILLVTLTACGPVGTATLEAKPTSTPTSAPPLVQAPLDVAPACIPPAPGISNVNSFCANYAAGLGEWVTVITGVIFVICVLLFRRGIVGELAAFYRGMTSAKTRSN